MTLLHQLDSVLKRHEGDLEVILQMTMGTASTRIRSRNRRVEWNNLLAKELSELIGADAASVEKPGEATALVPERELASVA
jgi:hypothetical protein